MDLSPFVGQTVSASVVTVPIVGTLTGLAYASKLAVQAASDPVLLYLSVDGARWHPYAHLQADEVVELPFVEGLRCDPDGGATLLARFPLR